MDDIVKQALRKWPNVPACKGWLGLDMRGNWWLRDTQAQAQGPFPQSKGTRLEHDKLLAFIGRNYEANEHGEWFFQNGPQRVYVELELTPMVWRVYGDGRIISHTGVEMPEPSHCWVDERGHLYLLCNGILGVVHTQDMVHAAVLLEHKPWVLEECLAAELPQKIGFVQSPVARSAQVRG